MNVARGRATDGRRHTRAARPDSMASRTHCANGGDATHWHIGRLGNKSSTKSPVLFTKHHGSHLGQIAYPISKGDQLLGVPLPESDTQARDGFRR